MKGLAQVTQPAGSRAGLPLASKAQALTGPCCRLPPLLATEHLRAPAVHQALSLAVQFQQSLKQCPCPPAADILVE